MVEQSLSMKQAIFAAFKVAYLVEFLELQYFFLNGINPSRIKIYKDNILKIAVVCLEYQSYIEYLSIDHLKSLIVQDTYVIPFGCKTLPDREVLTVEVASHL